MMLPSDIVLIQDPAFKKYVQAYAKDQKVGRVRGRGGG
jgi:catalase (peroxidase I)